MNDEARPLAHSSIHVDIVLPPNPVPIGTANSAGAQLLGVNATIEQHKVAPTAPLSFSSMATAFHEDANTPRPNTGSASLNHSIDLEALRALAISSGESAHSGGIEDETVMLGRAGVDPRDECDYMVPTEERRAPTTTAALLHATTTTTEAFSRAVSTTEQRVAADAIRTKATLPEVNHTQSEAIADQATVNESAKESCVGKPVAMSPREVKRFALIERCDIEAVHCQESRRSLRRAACFLLAVSKYNDRIRENISNYLLCGVGGEKGVIPQTENFIPVEFPPVAKDPVTHQAMSDPILFLDKYLMDRHSAEGLIFRLFSVMLRSNAIGVNKRREFFCSSPEGVLASSMTRQFFRSVFGFHGVTMELRPNERKDLREWEKRVIVLYPDIRERLEQDIIAEVRPVGTVPQADSWSRAKQSPINVGIHVIQKPPAASVGNTGGSVAQGRKQGNAAPRNDDSVAISEIAESSPRKSGSRRFSRKATMNIHEDSSSAFSSSARRRASQRGGGGSVDGSPLADASPDSVSTTAPHRRRKSEAALQSESASFSVPREGDSDDEVQADLRRFIQQFSEPQKEWAPFHEMWLNACTMVLTARKPRRQSVRIVRSTSLFSQSGPNGSSRRASVAPRAHYGVQHSAPTSPTPTTTPQNGAEGAIATNTSPTPSIAFVPTGSNRNSPPLHTNVSSSRSSPTVDFTVVAEVQGERPFPPCYSNNNSNTTSLRQQSNTSDDHSSHAQPSATSNFMGVPIAVTQDPNSDKFGTNVMRAEEAARRALEEELARELVEAEFVVRVKMQEDLRWMVTKQVIAHSSLKEGATKKRRMSGVPIDGHDDDTIDGTPEQADREANEGSQSPHYPDGPLPDIEGPKSDEELYKRYKMSSLILPHGNNAKVVVKARLDHLVASPPGKNHRKPHSMSSAMIPVVAGKPFVACMKMDLQEYCKPVDVKEYQTRARDALRNAPGDSGETLAAKVVLESMGAIHGNSPLLQGVVLADAPVGDLSVIASAAGPNTLHSVSKLAEVAEAVESVTGLVDAIAVPIRPTTLPAPLKVPPPTATSSHATLTVEEVALIGSIVRFHQDKEFFLHVFQFSEPWFLELERKANYWADEEFTRIAKLEDAARSAAANSKKLSNRRVLIPAKSTVQSNTVTTPRRHGGDSAVPLWSVDGDVLKVVNVHNKKPKQPLTGVTSSVMAPSERRGEQTEPQRLDASVALRLKDSDAAGDEGAGEESLPSKEEMMRNMWSAYFAVGVDWISAHLSAEELDAMLRPSHRLSSQPAGLNASDDVKLHNELAWRAKVERSLQQREAEERLAIKRKEEWSLPLDASELDAGTDRKALLARLNDEQRRFELSQGKPTSLIESVIPLPDDIVNAPKANTHLCGDVPQKNTRPLSSSTRNVSLEAIHQVIQRNFAPPPPAPRAKLSNTGEVLMIPPHDQTRKVRISVQPVAPELMPQGLGSYPLYTAMNEELPTTHLQQEIHSLEVEYDFQKAMYESARKRELGHRYFKPTMYADEIEKQEKLRTQAIEKALSKISIEELRERWDSTAACVGGMGSPSRDAASPPLAMGIPREEEVLPRPCSSSASARHWASRELADTLKVSHDHQVIFSSTVQQTRALISEAEGFSRVHYQREPLIHQLAMKRGAQQRVTSASTTQHARNPMAPPQRDIGSARSKASQALSGMSSSKVESARPVLFDTKATATDERPPRVSLPADAVRVPQRPPVVPPTTQSLLASRRQLYNPDPVSASRASEQRGLLPPRHVVRSHYNTHFQCSAPLLPTLSSAGGTHSM